MRTPTQDESRSSLVGLLRPTRDRLDRRQNLINPALRGKRARWLGSLDQPHTLNYLEDMARALVASAGGDRG